MSKPKIGIFGLTSCAGDQLAILNCEDELLDIVGAVDIKSFIMAQSELKAVQDQMEDSRFDLALVEGAVVTDEDEKMLKKIRDNTKLLIAIGTCAAWGGIPASRNDLEREELYQIVYGRRDDLFGCDKPRPLRDFVQVDFSLLGCPIEKEEILRAFSSLLHEDVPVLPTFPVCFECKLNENLCIFKEKDDLCHGSVTLAGCGARCPSHGVPCRGCRGPVDEANIPSVYHLMKEKGYPVADVERALRTFTYNAEIPQ